MDKVGMAALIGVALGVVVGIGYMMIGYVLAGVC